MTDLPEPHSPTSATVSPWLDVEARRGRTACDLAAALPEGDGEIADRRGAGSSVITNVLRGSKASRTASPMKTSSVSITAQDEEAGEAEPGRLQVALALASSSPSEGEPGGRPKPRKSSEVSVVIEPVRMKGRKVSVATMALGRMWRNMIARLRDAQRAGGADIFEVARAQEFGAHHADQRRPAEQQHEPSSDQKLGCRSRPR